MKVLFLFLSLFILLNIKLVAQDTTYFSDYELTQLEYGNLIDETSDYVVLDYAVTAPRENLKKLRTDSTNINLTASEWIMLYHAFNISDPYTDLEDSTFTFTAQIFDYWNYQTVENEVLTLPVGVIYKHASFIKDNSYSNNDLVFSSNELNYGWNLNNVNIENVLEHHIYGAVSLLYDEPIADQEIRLVLDDQFIFTDSLLVEKININYGGENFELTTYNSVNLILKEDEDNIVFDIIFDDGTNYTKNFNFNINSAFFDDDLIEKSNPFTGGKYTFIDPDISQPKLRYGIIWGNCNNSGKINKPVIMLHGYRPTVQPILPTLKKLYNSKFNFKGASQYGSDGLVDLLVKNGYDVIICRLDPGYLSITDGGKVMAEFIRNVVEVDKSSLGSKHENIVLGFSMGGHYLRYMIMYEDHRHLNLGQNYHHHTRLWIPTDTPLHGANNPLAHQFAAKSLAENPVGFPSFNIAYNNILTPGSQEQQRYGVNGTNGNDGATHRFHQRRVNYINELENTFNLGSTLTKYSGFPSSTRNIAISVGSNSLDDYTNLNAGQITFKEQSSVFNFINTLKRDVLLRAAKYRPIAGSMVFKRKIFKENNWNNNVNVLVDDHFHLLKWYELDNCNGSYFNTIRDAINTGLKVNSILGFTDIEYEDNQVFVPTLSALAIHPSFWPTDMRMNLKDEGLMFNELGLNYNNPSLSSNHYGYPHLGRPNDHNILTPMDAYYCNDLTFEHITLIDDENNQNDQSELIDFLLNEIEPWYLDLQNQDLGAYARPDYTYQAKYQARNIIQTGEEISPKTPFGEYRLLPNTDVNFQAGEAIHLKPGTHIQSGARAHLYIAPVNYDCNAKNKMAQNNANNKKSNTYNNTSEFETKISQDNKLLTIYPNPNSGTFVVRIKAEDFQNGKLEVYNIQGQLIDEISVKDGSTLSLKGNFTSKTLLLARLKDQNGHYVDETKIMIK